MAAAVGEVVSGSMVVAVVVPRGSMSVAVAVNAAVLAAGPTTTAAAAQYHPCCDSEFDCPQNCK